MHPSATALKMNMNLRELYLADNKLNGLQDSAQLGNLLKFNYNIQALDLRNNNITDSGLSLSLWSRMEKLSLALISPFMFLVPLHRSGIFVRWT